jgi:hypothetical protein
MNSPIIWVLYHEGKLVYKGNEEGLYKKIHELLDTDKMRAGEDALNLDIAVNWMDDEPYVE